jgi:hypothetical protein
MTTTCSSFAAAGFVPGQILSINGQTLWTVVQYSGKSNGTLTVSGPPLPASGTFTVVAYSSSPLVVFGSSSQNGVFYSGLFDQQSAFDYGSKPFPDVIGDGAPDFIWPVADPYRYQGNNVIDVSALDAGVPAKQLPSYGITAYGGGGDSTIIDSISGVSNFYAISDTKTTIVSQNGTTRIAKLDGLNVDPLTRALSFPTVNTSTNPDSIAIAPGPPPIKGTTPPNSPTIVLDPAYVSSSSTTQWVTTSDHPVFDVSYKLVLNGVTEPATQYANGQSGVNYKLWLNGILYTGEPFLNGTYTVTGTITDYYGNTSNVGTASKVLVIDDPIAPVPPVAGSGGQGNTAPVGSSQISSGSTSAGTISSGSTQSGSLLASPLPTGSLLAATQSTVTKLLAPTAPVASAPVRSALPSAPVTRTAAPSASKPPAKKIRKRKHKRTRRRSRR